jgi:hypothetical protein
MPNKQYYKSQYEDLAEVSFDLVTKQLNEIAKLEKELINAKKIIDFAYLEIVSNDKTISDLRSEIKKRDQLLTNWLELTASKDMSIAKQQTLKALKLID